jgi:hypothetical protein
MKLSRAASIALPVVAGLATLAGLSLSANAAPARPASAAPKIAVYDCANKPVVRPKEFLVFCDGSNDLIKLSWSAWNTTEATGTGVQFINNCVPNCASGTWKRENVLVVLWRGEPVAHHKGQRAYSKMTLLYPATGRTQTQSPPGAFN